MDWHPAPHAAREPWPVVASAIEFQQPFDLLLMAWRQAGRLPTGRGARGER